MKIFLKPLILSVFIMVLVPARAQTPLSVSNAVDTALLRNFELRIARNNLNIARQENTFGMAGSLPQVSASGNTTLSVNNTSQQYEDESDISSSGVGEHSLVLGLSGSMTLFNGFKIVATKERLNLLETRGEIQLNHQIQTVVADVMLSYYDIVRQQSYLEIIRQTVEVSEEKFAIAELRKNIGMADAVETLQAASDLNTARQQMEMQEMMITQSFNTLVNLINLHNKEGFVLTDTISLDTAISSDSVMFALNRNLQLLSSETDVSVYRQLLKETKAERYPSLKLNAGYDFFNNNFNKGNLITSRTYGPWAGVSLQIPVFNGFVLSTRKETAEIRLLNARLEKERLMNDLTESARNLFAFYSTAISLIEEQRSNLVMSAKLLEVVLKQYHLNQATILEVKAAQSSYENAAYQLTNLIYSAKSAEIGLKQLTNSLIF